MAQEATRRQCECLWGGSLDDERPEAPCPGGHNEDGCTREAEVRLIRRGDWVEGFVCEPCARAWLAPGEDWRRPKEVVEDAQSLAELVAGLVNLIAVDELLLASQTAGTTIAAQTGSTVEELEMAVEQAKRAELATALKVVANTAAAQERRENAQVIAVLRNIVEAYLDGAFDDK